MGKLQINQSPPELTEFNADGESATLVGQPTATFLYGFNGSTWDRVRIANTFKTLSATASGNTAVWTPGAGSKFRLMGFEITVVGTLSAAGIQVIELLDGATVIKNFLAYVGTTGAAAQVFAEDMGQGYLSTTAANVLNINLGTAMSTGAVTINAWGTQGANA